MTNAQARRRYKARHPERVAASDRLYARKRRARQTAEDRKKQHARNLLNRAIARGDIARQPCERCGREPGRHGRKREMVEGHHEDYGRWRG